MTSNGPSRRARLRVTAAPDFAIEALGNTARTVTTVPGPNGVRVPTLPCEGWGEPSKTKASMGFSSSRSAHQAGELREGRAAYETIWKRRAARRLPYSADRAEGGRQQTRSIHRQGLDGNESIAAYHAGRPKHGTIGNRRTPIAHYRRRRDRTGALARCSTCHAAA